MERSCALSSNKEHKLEKIEAQLEKLEKKLEKQPISIWSITREHKVLFNVLFISLSYVFFLLHIFFNSGVDIGLINDVGIIAFCKTFIDRGWINVQANLIKDIGIIAFSAASISFYILILLFKAD